MLRVGRSKCQKKTNQPYFRTDDVVCSYVGVKGHATAFIVCDCVFSLFRVTWSNKYAVEGITF